MADVEFIDNRVQVNRALDDAVGKFLLESSAEIVSAAAKGSRVDEGDLKGSWKANVDESKGLAVIGSELENAIWEEFGTGAWAEGPKPGRSDPWYVPVEGYSGKKRPTFNGEVVIVYGKKGKKYYKTNGKKPNRTLQRAFDKNKRKIINRAKQIFKEGMN